MRRLSASQSHLATQTSEKRPRETVDRAVLELVDALEAADSRPVADSHRGAAGILSGPVDSRPVDSHLPVDTP